MTIQLFGSAAKSDISFVKMGLLPGVVAGTTIGACMGILLQWYAALDARGASLLGFGDFFVLTCLFDVFPIAFVCIVLCVTVGGRFIEPAIVGGAMGGLAAWIAGGDAATFAVCVVNFSFGSAAITSGVSSWFRRDYGNAGLLRTFRIGALFFGVLLPLAFMIGGRFWASGDGGAQMHPYPPPSWPWVFSIFGGLVGAIGQYVRSSRDVAWEQDDFFRQHRDDGAVLWGLSWIFRLPLLVLCTGTFMCAAILALAVLFGCIWKGLAEDASIFVSETLRADRLVVLALLLLISLLLFRMGGWLEVRARKRIRESGESILARRASGQKMILLLYLRGFESDYKREKSGSLLDLLLPGPLRQDELLELGRRMGAEILAVVPTPLVRLGTLLVTVLGTAHDDAGWMGPLIETNEDEWLGRVQALMHEVDYLVISPDNSVGIKRELEEVFSRCDPERIIMWLPRRSEQATALREIAARTLTCRLGRAYELDLPVIPRYEQGDFFVFDEKWNCRHMHKSALVQLVLEGPERSGAQGVGILRNSLRDGPRVLKVAFLVFLGASGGSLVGIVGSAVFLIATQLWTNIPESFQSLGFIAGFLGGLVVGGTLSYDHWKSLRQS